MWRLIAISFLCFTVGCQSFPHRHGHPGFGQTPKPAVQAQAPSSPLFTPPFRSEWSVEQEEAFRETMETMARIGVVVALEVLRNQR
jgi:hypothetical protein